MHICFHSDNMAVVAEISQMFSPHAFNALYSAFYGFYFSARHVPGVLNEVADALSRNKADHISSFISQVPRFHWTDQLHRLLISERPDWGSQSWMALLAH